MKKKSNNRKLVIALLILAIFIAFAPLFLLKDAEFGGSDDRGNTLIETTDPDYKPWATPILEVLIGGELPSEVESMLFCVQTGSVDDINAFLIRRFVERRKWIKEDNITCADHEQSAHVMDK